MVYFAPHLNTRGAPPRTVVKTNREMTMTIQVIWEVGVAIDYEGSLRHSYHRTEQGAQKALAKLVNVYGDNESSIFHPFLNRVSVEE